MSAHKPRRRPTVARVRELERLLNGYAAAAAKAAVRLVEARIVATSATAERDEAIESLAIAQRAHATAMARVQAEHATALGEVQAEVAAAEELATRLAALVDEAGQHLREALPVVRWLDAARAEMLLGGES